MHCPPTPLAAQEPRETLSEAQCRGHASAVQGTSRGLRQPQVAPWEKPLWRPKDSGSQKSVVPLNLSGCQHKPQQLMSKKISLLFHVKKHKYYITDSEGKYAEGKSEQSCSKPWGQLIGWDASKDWNENRCCSSGRKKESLHFWSQPQQANTWTKHFKMKMCHSVCS